MADLPTCPKCNSLAVGERCGTCGAEIKRPAPAVEMASVSVPGLGLDLESKPAAGKTLGRTREAAVYLQLQPSEQAVLAAASRILAGFANGTLTQENEGELCDRSVRLAARMAVVIERYVQSDDEDW